MAKELNAAYMSEVSKGFSKVFSDALKVQKNDYTKIATEIKSSTMSVDYRWLSDMPKMKEWVGERDLKKLSGYSYLIAKKDWEASISIDRDVILYDGLGIAKPKIQALAEASISHYDELIFPLLEINGKCYDEKAFFAVDHDINGAKFSNLGTKKLSQESFLHARGEMRGLVSSTLKPMRILPTLLVVPPELEKNALEILKSEKIDGGSNITYNMCELLVSEYLTDANAWYLLDTSRSLKPLILQINKPITFSALDSPTSENVFMRKEFVYGVESQDNAGYGLWQFAYKSSGVA